MWGERRVWAMANQRDEKAEITNKQKLRSRKRSYMFIKQIFLEFFLCIRHCVRL